MRFNITGQIKEVTQEPVVGNVYNVKGGSGARHGHMQVLVSLTETGCVMLTVDRDGNVIGGSCYAKHYIREKVPTAYCEGLEELSFDIRSI